MENMKVMTLENMTIECQFSATSFFANFWQGFFLPFGKHKVKEIA